MAAPVDLFKTLHSVKGTYPPCDKCDGVDHKTRSRKAWRKVWLEGLTKGVLFGAIPAAYPCIVCDAGAADVIAGVAAALSDMPDGVSSPVGKLFRFHGVRSPGKCDLCGGHCTDHLAVRHSSDDQDFMTAPGSRHGVVDTICVHPRCAADAYCLRVIRRSGTYHIDTSVCTRPKGECDGSCRG